MWKWIFWAPVILFLVLNLAVVLSEEWKQWQGPVVPQHISCVLWVVRKPQPSDATFGKKQKESKREAWKISNEEVVASFEKGKLLTEL